VTVQKFFLLTGQLISAFLHNQDKSSENAIRRNIEIILAGYLVKFLFSTKLRQIRGNLCNFVENL